MFEVEVTIIGGGIVGCAVDRLRERGVASRTLRAALGPAVGPCCYAVGPEVVEAVSGASGAAPEQLTRRVDQRTTLDLAGALRLQLLEAGLDEGAISISPWCTSCRGDLFFSQEDYGHAAQDFEKVIQIDHRNLGAYYKLGDLPNAAKYG